MHGPRVINGRGDEVMDAPSVQNNRLLTAYTWLAMFHRSNRPLREERQRFSAGSLFRRVSQLKTRFHEGELDEDRYLLPYLSAKFL
jgi:hypothetical protein